MKYIFLIPLFLFISFKSFSSVVNFSYKGIEISSSDNKDVVLIRNNLDVDNYVQLWKNESLDQTIKITAKRDKTINISSNFKYFIMGINPPTKKVYLNNL